MPGQTWFDALRGDLARRGLPRAYVERFLRELEDHVQDVFQEQEESMRMEALEMEMAVEQRLGGCEELAEQAVAKYRRANFAGRHPVWTFVVAPLPAAILAWVLYLVLGSLVIGALVWALGGGMEGLERLESEQPAAAVWAARSFYNLSAFVPPAVVVLVWCRLARRSGRGWAWALASCLLIATIAGLFVWQLRFPTPEEKGALLLGLGFQPRLIQAVQFAVPLAIAAAYAYRTNWAAKARRTPLIGCR